MDRRVGAGRRRHGRRVSVPSAAGHGMHDDACRARCRCARSRQPARAFPALRLGLSGRIVRLSLRRRSRARGVPGAVRKRCRGHRAVVVVLSQPHPVPGASPLSLSSIRIHRQADLGQRSWTRCRHRQTQAGLSMGAGTQNPPVRECAWSEWGRPPWLGPDRGGA